MDDTSLLITSDDNKLTVPRKAITKLEVSTGKRRHALQGLLIGAAVGVLASCLKDCGDSGYLASGAGWGGLWGLGIGAVIVTDRWSPVPLNQVQVTTAPTPRPGLQLMMSLRF